MIPVPGRRLLLLLLLPLFFIIPGLFTPGLLSIGIALDVVILVGSFVDIMATLTRKEFNVELEATPVFSIGRHNRIRIAVKNPGAVPLMIELTVDVPDHWEDKTDKRTALVMPGEEERVDLWYRPLRRGVFEVKHIHARYASIFSLFHVHEKIPADFVVEVFPDIRELNHFIAMARKNRLVEMGMHRNRLRGAGTELESLREYHRDDDSRRIEWKVTTRVGKPVSKVFQLETSNNIVLVLDCGRLMTAEQDGLSALDHSINALLILAHIIVGMGDRLSIIAFSDRIIGELPLVKGKNSIRKVSHFLARLQPEFVESNYRLVFSYLRTRVRKRSLIIFLSDMIDDINYAVFKHHLNFLNRRNVALFIMLRDVILVTAAESSPKTAKDLFVSASAREMFLRRRDALARLRHSGINLLDVLPGHVTPRLVEKFLEIKARNLI